MELCRDSVLLALLLAVTCSVAAAYDPLDPNGNITLQWDVISWTPDGYVATVAMNNYQQYRHIMAPGWTLGWSWAKKEVIWSVVGAQATEQGDCSKFKGDIPHSCMSTPTIVDLLPGVPYNQQIANCCKAGVVAAYGQDPAGALSAFQVSVGLAGTTNKTVKLPRNFTLMGPGPGYTCGPARVVPSTVYWSPDHRRRTQALMTWTVTCTYSQQLASKYPSCCVSFSSFYNSTIVPCAGCACGCGHGHGHGGRECIMGDSKRALSAGVNTPRKDGAPLLQCTSHMCPIRVHWHIKLNYKDYWRAKIAITNFNYRMNYTQWTLVAQHPNLDNVTEVFSFQYKPLLPYGTISKETTRACSTASSSTTTCSWRPAHSATCSRRCSCARTPEPSPSARDGPSRARSTSTATSARCRRRTPTPTCPTPPSGSHLLPRRPSCSCCSYWRPSFNSDRFGEMTESECSLICCKNKAIIVRPQEI